MDTAAIHLSLGLGLQSIVGWFLPIYIGVANVIPFIATIFYYADKSREYNKHLKERNATEDDEDELVDFIVVGGGTAGSVVANRLSQQFKVLLLEMGGDPNPLTSVPGLESHLLGLPQLDYKYLTVPQNVSCFALNNRQSQWNSGAVLGGTSAINSMTYIRGHPLDYDRWATYTRDPRWMYQNLLPYFSRSEGYCEACDNTIGVKPTINKPFHNTMGQLPTRPLPISPAVPEFLEALEWGSVQKGDLNSPYNKPIADVNTYTMIKGRRVSTYDAFVKPLVDKSENLRIIKYARVIQVLFEPGTTTVVGVQYERFGKLENARARKEVILSAGAIATPKILMLSGIGPPEDLKRLRINPQANLPVGRNLQDHVGTLLGPFIIHSPLSVIPNRDLDEDEAEAYLHSGIGPFSITQRVATSLWSSTRALYGGQREWPDIQVSLIPTGIGQTIEKDLARQYNFREDIMKAFFDPVKGRDAFFLFIRNGRPKARGSLTLQSTSFLDPPVINPNYYQDLQHDDVHVTMEGIMRAVYLIENAPSFKKLGAKLSPVPFPTCKRFPHRSPEYWECVTRHFTLTAGDYSGTASMGSIDNPNSVVDSELRVIGIKNLRVIDSSVFPFIVSSSTAATTIMIGERGADFIINGYKK